MLEQAKFVFKEKCKSEKKQNFTLISTDFGMVRRIFFVGNSFRFENQRAIIDFCSISRKNLIQLLFQLNFFFKFSGALSSVFDYILLMVFLGPERPSPSFWHQILVRKVPFSIKKSEISKFLHNEPLRIQQKVCI